MRFDRAVYTKFLDRETCYGYDDHTDMTIIGWDVLLLKYSLSTYVERDFLARAASQLSPFSC